MSRNRQPRKPVAPALGKDAQTELVLDLDRYIPALITFIANKLSRSATVLYHKRFAVNVTEWRILALLARMHCRVRKQDSLPPTRIFSRCGKHPIQTYP